MMAIFSEFIEEIVEVFMDYFSIYGKTFMDCLANLDKVLTSGGRLGVKLGKVPLHG
jgi:predicted secreted Zn-dependent protease